MKHKSLALVLLLLVSTGLQAQTEDFNEFRNRMMKDFQDFRKGIFDRYAEFLDAAWAEYETMSGRRRVTTPKPTVAPVYTPPKEPVKPVQQTPVVPDTPEVTPEVTPVTPVHPETPVTPVTPVAPVNPETPKTPVTPEAPTTPKVPATPKVPSTPATPKVPETPKAPTVPSPTAPQITFTLYGLQLAVPAPKLDATLNSATQQAVVQFWKQINESDTKACVDALKQHAENYRLGDWCTFKAVETYCNKWAKGSRESSRVMMQYLMLSMGYDVRMAIAGNEVYLMLPFEQKVYENTYLTVNDMKYYVYPKSLPNGSSIYSCAVPAGTDCGRRMDLIVNPAYRLPRSNQPFALSHGGLSAQGNVNKNVIALLQEYPAMDIYCYAASLTDAEVRRSVVNQLKEQLAGMSEAQAANALLHFVQSAFEYQTDRQQFGDGVEKSFFFDETLYFPYCDCEDRSIFYAYLVHEILGLDVLLVGYPGHECTAVALSATPPSATGFTYRGKSYYICDPTYIGADIGMCMPDFVNVRPEVEEWY